MENIQAKSCKIWTSGKLSHDLFLKFLKRLICEKNCLFEALHPGQQFFSTASRVSPLPRYRTLTIYNIFF